MIVKLNEKFKRLFKEYMSSQTTTYNSTYTSNYKTSTYIYFYEWSDMSRGCKVFNDTTEFYKFLKESNISCTEEQKNKIHSCSWVYASCIPGINLLIVENQYYALKETLANLNLCKDKPKCTSLVISKK